MEEMELKEFRESGLLWYINQQLHLFGVSLTVEVSKDGDVRNLKPMKCSHRGFSVSANDDGYEKLTKYLGNNIEKLTKDVLE